MTKTQIDRIVTVNGIVKGGHVYRTKINGRTIGLSELKKGEKNESNRVRIIYEGVLNGTL